MTTPLEALRELQPWVEERCGPGMMWPKVLIEGVLGKRTLDAGQVRGPYTGPLHEHPWVREQLDYNGIAASWKGTIFEGVIPEGASAVLHAALSNRTREVLVQMPEVQNRLIAVRVGVFAHAWEGGRVCILHVGAGMRWRLTYSIPGGEGLTHTSFGTAAWPEIYPLGPKKSPDPKTINTVRETILRRLLGEAGD